MTKRKIQYKKRRDRSNRGEREEREGDTGNWDQTEGGKKEGPIPSAGSRTLLWQKTHTHAHKKNSHMPGHTHAAEEGAAAAKCHSPALVPSSRQPELE